MEGYQTPPQEGYLVPPQAGPRTLGAVVPLAAGAYTDIISIIAPSEAPAGQVVSIQVSIKNTYTSAMYIAATAQYDGVDIAMSPDYAAVDPGATYSFYGSFTMPNQAVRVSVWAFYWMGEEWYQDDYDYKDIGLTFVYKGYINRKELEYDSNQSPIPVSNIPQNLRGLVHIWGMNQTTEACQMGIAWALVDPDGVTRESYSAWEAWPYTPPGDDHEFIGGRFPLDKPGTWLINVLLYMNPGSPQVVDSYDGVLCTVQAAVPEPSFQGFGIKEYIKA